MNKTELKKQLHKIGINVVNGNYIKKKDLDILIHAEMSPSDKRKIDQILDEYTVIAREDSAVSSDEYISRKNVEIIIEKLIKEKDLT